MKKSLQIPFKTLPAVLIAFGLLFVRLTCLEAQSKITFQLDLQTLVDEGYLEAGEEVRVFVRGTFNDWKGDAFELVRMGKVEEDQRVQDQEHFYTGSFEIGAQPGDTLAYKYVLEKAGHIFWEKRPNPDNPENGNRLLVLRGGEQALARTRFYPSAYMRHPVLFRKEELRADFRQFRRILEDTHPALYDFTDKSVLDSLFDASYRAIGGDMDFRTFLMLMTRVISQVGCGHSSLWIPGAYWYLAPEGLFPLEVKISGGKLYALRSFTEQMIPRGSEILSIHGEAVPDILDPLKELSSADGLNPAYREAQVARNFAKKYAMANGFHQEFQVEYLPAGWDQSWETDFKGVSMEVVDAARSGHRDLSLREMEDGKVALLTLQTFGYYGQVDWFRSQMDSMFRVIEEKKISRLILDLRGNSGGDPFCASYLWAYLQPEALPYFEESYGKYDTLANPVPMAPRPFRGRLYTLIDGLCFSTTGHFIGLLDYHDVGMFIGSESGATFTCTGNATYPALDHTGIMVGTARVRRYTAAVKDMDPRRGILPDHPVSYSQDDLISGRDAVLEYALSLAGEEEAM